jgi:hypothetical protein
MSTTLRRKMVPLLAAPVALVCLATTAAAVIVTPIYNDEDISTVSSAICYYPNESVGLQFQANITTGDESGSDALDIKGMSVYMSDRNTSGDFYHPEAHATELKYTFGIADGENFVPTSGTFAAGSKLKNGVFNPKTKAADVQGVKFEATWRLLHPNRMRTVTCIQWLDGF